MGLPSIHIAFQTAADSAIRKSEKGVVGMVLLDAAAHGGHSMTGISEIPQDMSPENKAYLQRAFLGYVNQPRKVLAYVLPEDAADLQEGLRYLSIQQVDYVVGPPACTQEQGEEIKTWVLEQRGQKQMVKAVLPNIAADNEGIVNFTTQDIQTEEDIYTPAEYCSRIAGLITGTPMDISCTYAPLSEVSNIKRLPVQEADAAIDNGELILTHDGRKVKVARGVNSLKTVVPGKGDMFKKIKIVEAMDMIQYDLRLAVEDNYIGKFANSYDNKCVLLSAVKEYLLTLESAGILQAGSSVVEIDLEAQRAYLREHGADVSAMAEQGIKEADTGTFVFLQVTAKILDAIEDVTININV